MKIGNFLVHYYIHIQLQEYLKEYRIHNDINENDGHKYASEHMIVGFMQFIDKDIHMRVSNLDEYDIKIIKEKNNCDNCFSGGCWIVNVSKTNFGIISGDINYSLENNNIITDKLKSMEDIMEEEIRSFFHND